MKILDPEEREVIIVLESSKLMGDRDYRMVGPCAWRVGSGIEQEYM